MLERWMISPSPTQKDPLRHTLFLKAEMADVQLLIRKFGLKCGRPQKGRGSAEFNYNLYFHGLSPGGLSSVEAVLVSMNSQGRAAAPAPAVEAQTKPAQSSLELSAPSISIPMEPLPALKTLETPPPVPAVLEAGSPTPTPRSSHVSMTTRESPLWGTALAPDPKLTFDALIVGPFNRFAHAASMAVVANPGTMYNPLFLHGIPGVGKTHMMTAITHSIQTGHPGDHVFFTTGPRLSRIVQAAVAGGKLAELEAHVKKSKALMVDDIHLLVATEQSQPVLAAMFAHYFKSSKHVGMTSLYPPGALGALEEALKFQIGSGWSVEAKTPNAQTQRQIVQKMLVSVGIACENAEVESFVEHLGGNFFELSKWLRRLKAFVHARARAGQSQVMRDMLPVLFAATGGSPQVISPEQARALTSAIVDAPAEPAHAAKNLAVFYPKGGEEHSRLMLMRFHEAVRKHRLDLPSRQVVSQAYDPEQLYGVPFGLAQACENSKCHAALMLGPAPGSGLGAREGELSHALEHMLEGLGVALAWVPYSSAQQEATPYLWAILDLYSAWYPQ